MYMLLLRVKELSAASNPKKKLIILKQGIADLKCSPMFLRWTKGVERREVEEMGKRGERTGAARCPC